MVFHKLYDFKNGEVGLHRYQFTWNFAVELSKNDLSKIVSPDPQNRGYIIGSYVNVKSGRTEKIEFRAFRGQKVMCI